MQMLSTIIITYNSQEILNCLTSIYSTITTHFETIVVDNNSSDDSVEKIREQFPELKIIKNNINKGYGAACNQAIKVAQGKHILILNPDIVLEENTVEELLKYIEQNREAKIVSCKLKNADGTVQDSFRKFPTIASLILRQFISKNIKELTAPTKVDWVSGAFMLMRDKYYFDEKFFLYFEDVDLCKTVGDVYYYPLISATHLARRESKRNFKLAIIHAKSALKYFSKHGFFKANTFIKTS